MVKAPALQCMMVCHLVVSMRPVQASHIPAFYVAFVVTPYASNASELVSSLIFASRKHKKNISLTFSQVSLLLSMRQLIRLAVQACEFGSMRSRLLAGRAACCMLGWVHRCL